MLTTTESRVLYLLRKHDGRAKLQTISEAMHRFKAVDRRQALARLESLELINSAKTPNPKGHGGQGGLVYWLTLQGVDYVNELIESGAMRDPRKEPRAGKKRARA